MRSARIAVLALTLFATACATSGAGGDSGPRRNSSLITTEELVPLAGNTAYEAIQQLRPRWFNQRGGSPPVIFMDGSRQGSGDLESLHGFRVSNIREMRFIEPRDATLRFGTGFGSGVIDIITR